MSENASTPASHPGEVFPADLRRGDILAPYLDRVYSEPFRQYGAWWVPIIQTDGITDVLVLDYDARVHVLPRS